MVKLKKQSIDKIWNGTLLLLPDANVRKTNARGIELTDEQHGKKLPSLKKTGLASLHQPVLLGTAKSNLPVSEVYKQLLQAYFREHQKFKIPRPLRSLAQNDINREGQKYQQAVPS